MSNTSTLAGRMTPSPEVSSNPAGSPGFAASSAPDLISILVSRICHDLVSPVGAIVNGVDLVREIGGGDIDAELAMISQSSDRASALLQYYRIAFGAASDESEISRSSLHDQASALLTSQRIILQWPSQNGPHLTRRLARLLMQVLLCARGLAGMRGVISVNIPAGAALPIEVLVESEGGPETADMLALMQGETNTDDLSPRLVEFALARLTAQEHGLQLGISQSPGQIAIGIG